MAAPNTLSTLVNTSGVRQYFDFLPPGGVYLEANEEFSYTGSIYDWIRRSGNGGVRQKMITALDYCIAQGLCEIKADPDLILFDTTLGKSKKLVSDNGNLQLRDPSVPTVDANIVFSKDV